MDPTARHGLRQGAARLPVHRQVPETRLKDHLEADIIEAREDHEVHDVLIVGAGSAGLAALREVKKRTESFLIVNAGAYGTTCARVGCMPSKALIEAANAFQRREDFEAFGIRGAESLRVDTAAVLRRVRELRDGFVSGVLEATDSLGDRSVAGRARILGPGRVEVGGREIRAKTLILAPGSHPIVPQPWRELGDRVVTTDDLFELEELPQRMAVIGLGAIGVEMAQALARLGVRVTGFDAGDRLAGLSDEAVHEELLSILRDEMEVHLEAEAELSARESGVEVRWGDSSVEVDRVLVAVGRTPNVRDLGLENLDVELDERGLPDYDPTTLQVGDLRVFLVGDANGQRAILHEAADEGHIAGINSASDEVRCFQRRTPLNVVFSHPQSAVVGLSAAQADPETTRTARYDFARQGRARTAERNRGLLEVHADAESGRLLGAELCAPAGEHIAHLLALAIDRELSVHEFLRLPFYHPVIEEGLRSALRTLAKQVDGQRDSDLAACPDYDLEALD